MRSFSLLFILLMGACSNQAPAPAPAETLDAVRIRGSFSGYQDYSKWVVFLLDDKPFPVKPNGTFVMNLKDVVPGKYQFRFGPRSKTGYRSFQVPVFKSEINLGSMPVD